MIVAAEKKPALLCTFNADNGTIPTEYPWTDPNDIRPQVDGVDQQFVVSGANAWDLTSNQIQNRASATTAVGIDLGARARRLTLNIENDETTAVLTRLGILLRGSADLSTYLQVLLQRSTFGSLSLVLHSEVGANNGSTVSVVGTLSDAGTRQALEVIDTGSLIIATFSGQVAVWKTETYNAQTRAGISISAASATALQKLDALTAWT